MPILDPAFRERLRAKRQPKVLRGGDKRERDSAAHSRENEVVGPSPPREVMSADDEQPTAAPKDVTASVETDSAGILMRQSTDKQLGVTVVSVPITIARRSDTAQAPSAKPDLEQPPSWWWKKFFGVRDSICVSPQDAELCVRLVVGELLGPDRVLTINCEFKGESVSLREMYEAIGRISGNNHGWTTVQELWLRARKREGIQPNRGVPLLPPSNVNQASAPWLEQGSGMRRQLADDGAWCG